MDNRHTYKRRSDHGCGARPSWFSKIECLLLSDKRKLAQGDPQGIRRFGAKTQVHPPAPPFGALKAARHRAYLLSEIHYERMVLEFTLYWMRKQGIYDAPGLLAREHTDERVRKKAEAIRRRR